jgi:CheY-like chemotaxis protein
LVLVNRKLDRDGSDGVELIEKMKTREGTERIPVMLVSNYVEAQAVALKRGAEPGFGKNDLNDTETLESLAQYLPQRRSDSSG